MYFKRKSYSTPYPPVDTNFTPGVMSNPSDSLQIRSSIVYSSNGASTESDFSYFGFEREARSPLRVYLNGVDTGQDIQAGSTMKQYELDPTTKIFGYTVTPYKINLWTTEEYIDKAQPIMYGRRGLYVDPFKDDVYDWKRWHNDEHTGYTEFAVLHVYYTYGLYFRKVSTQAAGTKVYLYLEAGDEPGGIITPKFLLNSQVISTGTIEQEINSLNDKVRRIETQIAEIQTSVDTLVPNLTKLVSAEASKNYVAR